MKSKVTYRKIVQQLKRMGFEDVETQKERVSVLHNDYSNNSAGFHLEYFYEIESQPGTKDIVDFSIGVKNCNSALLSSIENIVVTYLRQYPSREILAICQQQFKNTFPNKAELTRLIQENVKACKFEKTEKGESKLISDKYGELAKQFSQWGFDPKEAFANANHQVHEKFTSKIIDYLSDKAATTEEYIIYRFDLIDSFFENKSCISYLSAGLYRKEEDSNPVLLSSVGYRNENMHQIVKENIIIELVSIHHQQILMQFKESSKNQLLGNPSEVGTLKYGKSKR
jgi:hypothetical protein